MATTLALPSGARPVRRRGVVIAAILFGTSALALVGALIAAYLGVDDAVREFPPADLERDNYTAVTTFITLLLASAAAEWAVYAFRVGQRGSGAVAYGIQLLLGVAGINALWYLGSQYEFGAVDSQFATLAYTMVGVSLVLLVLAAAGSFAAFMRALARTTDVETTLPRAAAIFWHFSVVAYFGVFFTLYLFHLMFS